MVYDTFMLPYQYDSSHVINDDYEFIALDDLTLVCNKFKTQWGFDEQLHYKSFNKVAGTITFQNFHVRPGNVYTSVPVATLTYNCLNNTVAINYVDKDDYLRRRADLQQ